MRAECGKRSAGRDQRVTDLDGGLPGLRRIAVVERPAVATSDDTGAMQRDRVRRQIGAACDAARDEVQVDAEERRVVVIHFAAGLRRIARVGELPDTVNLDGIELTGRIPDQSADIADRG